MLEDSTGFSDNGEITGIWIPDLITENIRTMGQFSKENQPPVKGRKKGSGNLFAGRVKELATELLESNFDQFTKHLNTLKAKDYCNTYLQLMKIVTPRQVDARIDYDSLTDIQLDQIITTIIQQHESETKEPEG